MRLPPTRYVGRFAPTPSGPLHAGSLVAALASWLDARAQGGHWLVRIEDVDTPRCVPGAAARILQQLATCGLLPDAPPLWQHRRSAAYASALLSLQARGLVYPCGCTRKDIGGHTYAGTCRDGLRGKAVRAMRLLTLRDGADVTVDWSDRRLGAQQQNVTQDVGDFVLKRADGLWAYQLAVVVDDAFQGITDIVRGEDLADNTARQIWLQEQLGGPRPRYWHGPLVLAADGHKLSKQNGATALDLAQPLRALQAAARVLELPALPAHSHDDWLAQAVLAWRARWMA